MHWHFQKQHFHRLVINLPNEYIHNIVLVPCIVSKMHMSGDHSIFCRYFKDQSHLVKVRNVVCSYVWTHMSEGYSQGMCDLLAPLMVVLDDEPLAYACYLKLMESAIKLFPPNTGMNTRLANIQALLQVCVCVRACEHVENS